MLEVCCSTTCYVHGGKETGEDSEDDHNIMFAIMVAVVLALPMARILTMATQTMAMIVR